MVRAIEKVSVSSKGGLHKMTIRRPPVSLTPFGMDDLLEGHLLNGNVLHPHLHPQSVSRNLRSEISKSQVLRRNTSYPLLFSPQTLKCTEVQLYGKENLL
ncbi:hypothetical protein CDAR_293941 [Caerostris darwini]|uniref:Uncharacterized protein n=1 Tax=Caerostris darwini TaxID=1538125 RepID=A0AAV4VG98_9ARAC|nr:hypothetical protein CDAR_293941 [Caerostris darwini]